MSHVPPPASPPTGAHPGRRAGLHAGLRAGLHAVLPAGRHAGLYAGWHAGLRVGLRWVLLAAGVLAAAGAAAQNIVVDPGFESNTLTPWGVPANPPPYSWTLQTATTYGLTARSGSHFAMTGCIGTACVPTTGSGTSGLTQTLATVPGNTYQLSFWIQNVSPNSAPAELAVTWGGAVVLDLADPLGSTTKYPQQLLPANAPAYTQFTVTVQATAASTVLAFYGRQDPAWFALDDVSVAPIVSGSVVLDNGAGGGTANDGVQNGSEAGHGGVSVNLSNCAGTTYSTAVTSGNGSFALATAGIPAGYTGSVCVTETLPPGFIAVSSNPGATGGTYTPATHTLSFPLSATSKLTGIVFGEVPASSFATSGAQQVTAGQAAVFSHVFTAGDKASVAFGASNSATPPSPGWTSVLYLDSTCSGTLSAADPVISAPIAVTAGQIVCILDKVSSPAGAAAGGVDLLSLSATETYSPVPSNGAIVHVLTQTDTTTLASSDLSLLKQVRVVASCPSTPADTNAFATANQAGPGNFLEYQISFANATAAPLTSIQIQDAVPVYTLYQSAQCTIVPAGIASCTVSQVPAVGASSGSIVWVLANSLSAPIGLPSGGAGAVRFCVKVTQ